MSKLKHILYTLIGMSIFSALILLISYTYIGSPKEWILKKQTQQYAERIDELDLKIKVLSNRLEEITYRDDNVYRVAFDLEPISMEERNVGLGGSDRYKALESYSNSKHIIGVFQNLDRFGRELYIQDKSLSEIKKVIYKKEDSLASIPAIQPISVRELKYISSKYGYRDHPKVHRWIKHTGIDFAALKGTPIHATGDGVVEPLKSSRSYYGKVVTIKHGFGYATLYAHMSKINVSAGDRVKRGQVIGYVGRTGRVTGSHLHYEVIKNGRSINPSSYYINDLTEEEYDDMIFVLSHSY
ncbi:MAG: M23 family metallopeptidase [Bacteroidales bacterium]|nr:M23 family metallopeptidase [Bacteroidales bacterium]